MTIRPYESSDFDAVWELHNIALEATGAHLGDGPWYQDLKDIPNVYLKNHGCYLVGLTDDRLVAMGAVKRTDSIRAEIKRMRVHPDFQQRGYGTEILKNLEAEARRLGYQLLHLDTATIQTTAQKFYEKHGYHKIGISSIGGIDIVLYEKRLSESD
jgi:ribosomal protein S18 acetylase RimI-like enzyme